MERVGGGATASRDFSTSASQRCALTHDALDRLHFSLFRSSAAPSSHCYSDIIFCARSEGVHRSSTRRERERFQSFDFEFEASRRWQITANDEHETDASVHAWAARACLRVAVGVANWRERRVLVVRQRVGRGEGMLSKRLAVEASRVTIDAPPELCRRALAVWRRQVL